MRNDHRRVEGKPAREDVLPRRRRAIRRSPLRRTTGLRNADNNLKLSQVSNEVHAISQVFTGAVYDILADIFEDYRKLDEYDPAETLFRIGKHVTALVIIALAGC